MTIRVGHVIHRRDKPGRWKIEEIDVQGRRVKVRRHHPPAVEWIPFRMILEIVDG